ncbi:hypothetical protein ABZ744_21255 [Micromonospora chersina]|uniref:hypothetical protein n=1 Tax=Micromonospora chersina TaxID=47854 RepID=UPI0033D3E90A
MGSRTTWGSRSSRRERDLWLAHTRLTGAEDDAYYEVRGLGERFVRAPAGSLAVVHPA